MLSVSAIGTFTNRQNICVPNVFFWGGGIREEGQPPLCYMSTPETTGLLLIVIQCWTWFDATRHMWMPTKACLHTLPSCAHRKKVYSYLEVNSREIIHFYLIPNVVVQHPNDRRSFTIWNCIKYFIYFRWVAHVNLGEKSKSSIGCACFAISGGGVENTNQHYSIKTHLALHCDWRFLLQLSKGPWEETGQAERAGLQLPLTSMGWLLSKASSSWARV